MRPGASGPRRRHRLDHHQGDVVLLLGPATKRLERFENRHYTSQIKTYFRRLETAVTAGDEAQITEEHRKLVSLIDKAVKRGALHANTGGRKKARAERMRSGTAVA